MKTWNQIALVAWPLVNLSLLFLQSGAGKSNWLPGLRAALPKHCMQQAQYEAAEKLPYSSTSTLIYLTQISLSSYVN